MLYRHVLRPLLYALPPELAHEIAFGALRLALAFPPLRALVRLFTHKKEPALEVEALGLRFPSPVGLAAGFDKDARGYEALGAAGFGFVEVGTITGAAQPGNPSPRLFRLLDDHALLNRMGFNNQGAERAAGRLDKKRRSTLVGVNIGKSKVVPEESAAEDYVRSTRLLARHADYFVVNVSSPNTPGLRNLQAVEKLGPLLRAVRQSLDAHAGRHVPLLVKIAPDLADGDVDAVAELALSLGLDGIIATNTTVRRDDLNTPAAMLTALGSGGVSGRPLRHRSLEVLRRLRERVGARVALISVGGIEDGAEAFRRIKAGASLVQIYTAYIYEGPSLPRRIAREMLELARREGYASVAEAIGADVS